MECLHGVERNALPGAVPHRAAGLLIVRRAARRNAATGASPAFLSIKLRIGGRPERLRQVPLPTIQSSPQKPCACSCRCLHAQTIGLPFSGPAGRFGAAKSDCALRPKLLPTGRSTHRQILTASTFPKKLTVTSPNSTTRHTPIPHHYRTHPTTPPENPHL